MGTRIRQVYAASRVIVSGEYGRYGDGSGASTVDRFEKELAAAFGTPHALAVNSGTNALTACLAAMRVGPGDEVLVPAYTWVSSAAAAVMVGAVPILVEIDESLTMDPADLEAKITPRTRAIVPRTSASARTTTMPPTVSPSPFQSARPRRISGPIATWATSLSSTGTRASFQRDQNGSP